MTGIARVALTAVVVALAVATLGYFLGPRSASRSQTIEIERPAATVLARLESTPVGSTVAEGVTISGPPTVNGDVVTAPVQFDDGAGGRIQYRVAARGDGAAVDIHLQRDLGADPLARMQAITGGNVGPLLSSAASVVESDLNALPNASFQGLNYSLVTVEAQPFVYVESCASSDSESINTFVADAASTLDAYMGAANLRSDGRLTLIENTPAAGQYCRKLGFPFRGRPPAAFVSGGVSVGATPQGAALRVPYSGSDADVVSQVYDPIDSLLAAAHLRSASTYEVYHDDPSQPGGSRDREVYFVVEGDLSALSAIAPSAAEVSQRGACLADLECVARCYRYQSEAGNCPSREQQVAALFKEGQAAYRDPPDRVEMGEWITIVFAISKTDTPVTPQSTAQRQPMRSVGSAPSADDNAAVAAARTAEAPGASANVTTEDLPLAPYLSASLDAPGFEIDPSSSSEDRRSCRVGDECVWSWKVRSLSPGERTVTVMLNGYLSDELDRSAEPLEPPHRHTVHVAITHEGLGRVIGILFLRYWAVLLGAIASIATIIGVIHQIRKPKEGS